MAIGHAGAKINRKHPQTTQMEAKKKQIKADLKPAEWIGRALEPAYLIRSYPLFHLCNLRML